MTRCLFIILAYSYKFLQILLDSSSLLPQKFLQFLQKNVKFLQVFTKFYLNLKVIRGSIPPPYHFTSYKFLQSWLNSYKVCTNLRTYMDRVSDVLSRRLLETPQNAETSYRHLHTKCQHCFDACGDSYTPIGSWRSSACNSDFCISLQNIEVY